MYRVSREGKRAPDTPPRSQRHRSATSYYQSARNRLHRLSAGDPWVRLGFNAAAILFILLAVRQMHRSMCDAERPRVMESRGGDLYDIPLSRKALYEKVEDGLQHERFLSPFFGGGLRGSGHRTEQSLIEDIENLKARLAENEGLAIKRIREMEHLENENDLLNDEVEDLKQQLAARRKLGLGTQHKVPPPLDRGVEESRTNSAVGATPTAVSGIVVSPSRASGGHRFGKQTTFDNGARPAGGMEEDLPNDAVGARGVAAETSHHDNEKLNAGVLRSPEERIIEAQSAGNSDKEVVRGRGDGGLAAAEMPFKKLKDVEDVDNLDFQVKEGVDWDQQKEEAREANNNDRLSEGKSRKPSTFLKQDGDILKDVADERKEEESVEVDPGITEKVEDKQLPASAGGDAPGDDSEKSSGERSQNSEEVKGVPIERPRENDEGASGTVAEKDEESRPAVKEMKEPEGVPLVEAGKGDGEKEKEESAPRGDEGVKAEEPGGNSDAAGVVDQESEGKPEKASPQFSVAKEEEETGKALSKDVVGKTVSGPEETLLKKAGNELKDKEQTFDAADKKAKLDDFERKVRSRKDKEGEELPEKEAVEGGEAEKDEERHILEQKFIQMQEDPSSTDDGEGRTSSSDDDGEVKDSAPDNKEDEESDGRSVASMSGGEADPNAPNRAEGGKERPAWVGDVPEGVIKKRDEEALNLLKELSHSAEDRVEESR